MFCLMCHLSLSIFSHNSSIGFGDLTEDATHGLNSALNRRGHSLRSQHKQAVNAYSSIATMECDFLSIQEDIEEWDDNGFTSPESEEEDT